MKLEIIAEQVIERRRQFADTLRTSLGLSSVQWEALGRVFALSNESRFNMYFNYPCLFREAFPSVADGALFELSWCGRVALDYILLYDYLLDTEHVLDPVILLASYAFQREWLCRLQSLFSSASPFWDYLARCEEETTRALLGERLRRQEPLAPFTMDDARQQAIGKAALSRLAIVGLASLTGQVESDRMHGLIRSNDHYNFARQVLDDLRDWRGDYTGRRISCLLSSALTYLGLEKHATDEDYPQANEVGGIMYTQVAPAYLSLAETGLNEALDLARDHGPCPHWQQVLEEITASVRKRQEVIAEVAQRARLNRIRTVRAKNPRESDVTIAIKAATAFLIDGQEPEGCWRDFATAAGESEDWITGYVGWALCSTGQLPSEALRRAIAWLQDSRFPEGGWGYRRDVVVDADSTAWCLRFLIRAGLSRRDLEKALQVLLMHQHSTGGFSTYDLPDDIRTWMQMEETQDFSGWCGPQLCVTAAATAALLDLGFELKMDNVTNAVDYMIARQQPKGYWHSYWWAGPYYATAHTLQVVSRLDGMDGKVTALAHEWLLDSQLADGGWSHASGQPSTPFYTALALQGLLVKEDLDPSTLNAVRRGVVWLVRHQEHDGSWRSSALLLLPQPQEREPWKIERWPVSVRGTGIARRDHRRLFTTATVLVALSMAVDLCPDL